MGTLSFSKLEGAASIIANEGTDSERSVRSPLGREGLSSVYRHAI